jgi:hypothetical protein
MTGILAAATPVFNQIVMRLNDESEFISARAFPFVIFQFGSGDSQEDREVGSSSEK